MNICHVNLATGFSGGERQTLVLIKEQIKLGYTLTVVANPKSPFFNEVEKLNPLKNKALSLRAYNSASAITGVSNKVVEVVKQRHPKAHAVFIPDSPARYTSDPIKVQQIREQFEGKFLVIKAAKMYKHKGFDIAIEAAIMLNDINKDKDIEFALLGDGPEFDALKNLASDTPNVHFMGNQAEIGNWFEAADLLIHTSHTEGMGSVILEAMAAGLPVVGSKAGGIPDVITHDKSGLLFEIADAKELSAHIQSLYNSKELRDRLIDGAAQHLNKFEIETTAQAYQSLYQQFEK
ncbi:glycosyltransferase family 4 protein [Vibrio fortis]